MTVCASIQIMT